MMHTIIALVQDHPGALNRTVSLFRRRGFNIHSIALGPSETPGISRMTLALAAADVEQVVKQLYRVIEVVKVWDVTAQDTLQRESALLKVHAPARARPEIVALCSLFQARVLDTGSQAVVIELTDTPATLDRFVELARPFGLKELARTGRIAMTTEQNGAQGTRGATPYNNGNNTESTTDLQGAQRTATTISQSRGATARRRAAL